MFWHKKQCCCKKGHTARFYCTDIKNVERFTYTDIYTDYVEFEGTCEKCGVFFKKRYNFDSETQSVLVAMKKTILKLEKALIEKQSKSANKND